MLNVNNITKYFLKQPPLRKKAGYYITGSIEERFRQTVLKDVTFNLQKGEALGLLGKNGAGKTTLIKIISNIVIPDKGEILINGIKNTSNIGKIGLVLNNERSFFWRLNTFDNLVFFGKLYGLSLKEIKAEIEKADSILGINEILNKRFYDLSSGMKQKLNLTRALLTNPEILILDEPTINLDIVNQRKFIEHIGDLRKEYGLTILWASHHLDEIENTCERGLILADGMLLWHGDSRELRQRFFDHCGTTLNKQEYASQNSVLAHTKPAVSFKKKEAYCDQKIGIYNRLKRLASLSWLFLKKDFKIEGSYGLSLLLDVLGIFFSAMSFYFISKLFYQGRVNPDFFSGNYFSFVLIGLAFMGFISTSLNGFSSSLRQAQASGVIEQILVSPISVFEYLFSSSIFVFSFSAFRFLVYLVFGLFLGVGFHFNLLGLSWAFVLFLLSVGVFSSFGIISASFIMIFKRGDPVNFFMGNLMGLFGEVYYPVSVLPSFLRIISFFVPLMYALRGIRACLFSSAGFHEIAPYLKILLLFFVILFPISIFFYKWALVKAKKEGTISLY